MSKHSEEKAIDISKVLGAFSEIEDPRKSPAKRHLFTEMLFIALASILAGAEGFVDMEEFGKSKIEWLRTFLKLPKGIPSHDAFGDLFALLDPQEFNTAFIEWTQHLRDHVSKEVVALDGKSMRGSHDCSNNKKMVHTVSAWAVENRLVLGQIATEEKSNEITAIPKLLKLLHLEGCVITLDAMGTQKKIAAQIIEQKAHYVMSLKENHETFHDEVKSLMECPETLREMKSQGAAVEFYSEENEDHGRVEKRSCVALEKTDWFREDWQWDGLKTLVMVERHRKADKQSDYSTERHFYISSLEANAEELGRIIRKHWSIENSLHWVLDVTYKEDACRVRKGHAASNLSTLRKWTLNLFKKAPGNSSVRSKQKKAAWNQDYLIKVLNF